MNLNYNMLAKLSNSIANASSGRRTAQAAAGNKVSHQVHAVPDQDQLSIQMTRPWGKHTAHMTPGISSSVTLY